MILVELIWDLDDPDWPRASKILMEVLLLEGNSSSFQLNGYCISESKILRRIIFINGSRVLESIRFMSVLWLIFVKNFVLKFKIYFLKYFEIFTFGEILKFFSVKPIQLKINNFGANERNALECLRSLGTQIKWNERNEKSLKIIIYSKNKTF